MLQAQDGQMRFQGKAIQGHMAEQGRRNARRKGWQRPAPRAIGPLQQQLRIGQRREAAGFRCGAGCGDTGMLRRPRGRQEQQQIPALIGTPPGP